jgi:hypothetical protein
MKKYIILALILLTSITIILTSSVYAYSPDVVNAMPLPNFEILKTHEVTSADYPIILDYTQEYISSYKVVEVKLNQTLNDGYPVTWYSLTSAQAPTSSVITFISFANENYKHDAHDYKDIGNLFRLKYNYNWNILNYVNTPNVLGGNTNYVTLEFTQNSTAIFVFKSSANLATQSALLVNWLNSGRFFNGSYNDFYATYINNLTNNLDEQYNNGYNDGFRAGQNQMNDKVNEAYNEAYKEARDYWAYKDGDVYYKGDVAYDMGYEKGLAEEQLDIWSALWMSFTTPFTLFEIEMLPGITIGMIALIPLVLGLIAFIFSLGGKKK